MTALTRRYIDQVVAHLPDGQREDISRELTALISDMEEERLATGASETAAERDALEELGDPARLAARYRNTPNYLIGPELYPVYVRALQWLVPIVLGVALIVNIVVYSTTEAEANIGAMIGQIVGPLISALFWLLGSVTVFFWIFERAAQPRDKAALARDGARHWSVDDLETEVAHAREARSEAIGGLVMLVLLALMPVIPTTFFYVGHLNDGGPFVNQDLWSFWLPAYYVLLAMEAVLGIWTIVRGRTTRLRLAARAALDVVAGVFLTMLVLTQQVIDPAINSGILQTSGATDWVDVLYLVVIWGVAFWDLYVCVQYWRTLGMAERQVTAE
ncbi:HAAS signaling domain-containing protein [Citricoccus sp.]|uniref:HAAS signaling domain-containing protein n=1 Tax=Citricoccus sp. TaxID=1978372 RepID=UPI0028BDBFFB|nr:permease prefix domain 1-containing protein [Citricoccus sp.]